jgi:hypothetical protein
VFVEVGEMGESCVGGPGEKKKVAGKRGEWRGERAAREKGKTGEQGRGKRSAGEGGELLCPGGGGEKKWGKKNGGKRKKRKGVAGKLGTTCHPLFLKFHA